MPNALYGNAVQKGRIDIQSILARLTVDDKLVPLTEGEKLPELSIYCKPAPVSTISPGLIRRW